jgi:methyl-accepting chemotaxis protein
MALQLGALRDALIEANVSPERAAAAAEEVAGYENRLTRLTTMVQAMIAIGLLLLGSQAALWMEAGKLNGTVSELGGRVTRLDGTVTQLSGTVNQLSGTVSQLSTTVNQLSATVNQLSGKVSQLDATVAQMDGKIDQIASTMKR